MIPCNPSGKVDETLLQHLLRSAKQSKHFDLFFLIELRDASLAYPLAHLIDE